MESNFVFDRWFRSAEVTYVVIAVVRPQPVLWRPQPISLEFINLDLFQIALFDFSDVAFCF